MKACAGLTGLLLLASCALPAIPVAPASPALVEKLGSATAPKLSVGSFTPGPALGRGSDRSLTIRAATIRPQGGSFAAYLGQTLEAQLRSAGRLDPHAALVISGVLVRNEVSSAIGTGHGEVAAEFTVTQAGATIFRRTLEAHREWKSFFIGAAAIPTAETNYASLYAGLVGTLFDDPDFRRATGG